MNGKDAQYIKRCLWLARLAGKETGSNPQVGAVLVYKDRIIGEGFHQFKGGPHAEVNCINSLRSEDQKFISHATLYVSLEPCCHYGKTPPCTSLILESGIKHVVISAIDPSSNVGGKGISLLKKNGVKVITGILENEGRKLIAPFHIQQSENRPYIILKVVKSRDNYIGRKGEKIWMTNPYTDILTHKWRSEIDGIMVGTNTVINDSPSLTTRNYPGDDPVKVIVDRNHRIPLDNTTISGTSKMHYFSLKERNGIDQSRQEVITADNQLKSVLTSCYQKGINTLMVEGGSTLIKAMYKENLWDEARIITTNHVLHEGVKSIDIKGYLIDKQENLGDHLVNISRYLR